MSVHPFADGIGTDMYGFGDSCQCFGLIGITESYFLEKFLLISYSLFIKDYATQDKVYFHAKQLSYKARFKDGGHRKREKADSYPFLTFLFKSVTYSHLLFQ